MKNHLITGELGLDGLTTITGDPKYKQAAMDAIKYAFENLRSPNGLLYWGAHAAYDALGDGPCRNGTHELKGFYPYYELMWQVDPNATQQFIESFWAAHILDWSNLEMDRIGSLDRLRVPKGWEHEYKGGPVFFESNGRSFASTGDDLFYAATILFNLSGQKEPLIWGKRLAYRYIETRYPKIGISSYVYTQPTNATNHPLAEEFKGHMVNLGVFFPTGLPQIVDPIVRKCKLGYLIVSPGIPYTYVSNPWICYLLVGQLLGGEGNEFTQWALEELTARGKVAYRKIDNVWIPMLTDGTNLEGYVFKKDSAYGPRGTVFTPIPAVPMDFWAYALAYRLTGDEFMWEMARNIARGNRLGDIGATAEDKPKLQIPMNHFDPYTLLGFLELYRKTGVTAFLQAPQEVGDNILASRFHKGFFVPSGKHIYAKFDTIEALSLLHLEAAGCKKDLLVPQVWPGRPFLNLPFRDKEIMVDNALIYTLTESPEPPRSLQEAAACGNVNELKSLIEQGADVNAKEGVLLDTHLYRAVLNGHKEVVDLLLAKGAQVDARDAFPGGTALNYAAEKGHKEIAELLIAHGADVNAKRRGHPAGDTPLHSAVRAGHRDIIELLIAKGANVNAKDNNGQTPIDLAMNQGRKEIAKLLLSKSGDVSLHTAAYIGDLQRVEKFIGDGADVDAKDQRGQTALHYAAKAGQIAVAKLLIANGADINTGEWTPLQEAAYYSKEMVELLLAKGANINTGKWTALHSALDAERFDIVELLVAKDADVNIKDGKGRTPLHIAAWYAASRYPKIVEVLLSNGADINAKDNNGKTALSYAIENGHTEIVELLRKHGVKAEKQAALPSSAVGSQQHPDADMVFTGEALSDYFGGYLGTGGDVNGDGYVDLIVSAERWPNGNKQGRAYLFYGGPNIDKTPDMIFTGAEVDNYLGVGVALADINADRCADVIVGVPGYDSNRGRIYVYYGGAKTDKIPDKTFDGEDPNSWFGFCSQVDDLNGDNRPDLVVSAMRWDEYRGRVYIFYGSGGDTDTTPDIILDGENRVDRFGRQHALGKDVNGDGYPDVVVGAEYWYMGNQQGRAYLYFGGPKMDATPDVIFTGESGRFGNATKLCDIDNDGFADVIIGAPHSPNKAYLYFGGPDIDNVADKIFDFGDSIACGDVNKDGYKDIALGSGAASELRVYYGGPGRSIDQIPDKVFKGEMPNYYFGNWVRLSDLNGDGHDDLLVGTWVYNSNQGRVYLYYGGPDN